MSLAAALHQSPAHQIQRRLARVMADAVAVTAEPALNHLRFLAVAHAEIHQSHGLLFTPARMPGNARNSDAQSRIAPHSNPLGQRRRYFTADRALPLNQYRGNIRELRLQ